MNKNILLGDHIEVILIREGSRIASVEGREFQVWPIDQVGKAHEPHQVYRPCNAIAVLRAKLVLPQQQFEQ